MDLRQALSVLSKSSPYAVSTERLDLISTELDNIKIIFLCGSSGDGKLEMRSRHIKQKCSKLAVLDNIIEQNWVQID
jgi:DNA phosphorothioation-dependent restriction protein DptF